MSAAAQAAPAVTIPEIGQPYGGGFFSGITRDPDTGKRYLNITAGAEHELVGGHRARPDTEACARIYFAMNPPAQVA